MTTISGINGTASSRCTFTWSLEQNIAVKVFGGDAIERLRIIFAKTCADVEAQLIEMDGEDDHVHLLARVPAQARRRQSREQPQGRVRSPAAQGASRHPEALLQRRPVVGVLLRLVLRRRCDLNRAAIHRTATDTTLNPRTATPSALSFPALNGRACRAPGHVHGSVPTISHKPMTADCGFN